MLAVASISISIILMEVADFILVLNGDGVVNACVLVSISSADVMIASLNMIIFFVEYVGNV